MQSNNNFYEGQNIYIGIDVHARQWHVYCAPIESFGAKPVVMPPSADALLSYLQNHYPGGNYFSAYESGFCGFRAHRQLISMGIQNIVFNASDLKRSQKEQLRKTDAVDCKAIWENLKKGDLKPVFVPSEQQEEDRELLRTREALVRDIRRTKQRIKMFLHRVGHEPTEKFSARWSVRYIEWLTVLADSLNGGFSKKLSTLLSTYRHQNQLLKQLNKDIAEAVNRDYQSMYNLLITIPGVGRLLSAKLCLELVDFSRFADARHLAGYIGLVPDCKVSDQKGAVLGVSIRKNSILRSALIEASWVAISKDPAMGSAFLAYRNRGVHPNIAIVSIARKLVNRIFYIYRTGKPYVKSTK